MASKDICPPPPPPLGTPSYKEDNSTRSATRPRPVLLQNPTQNEPNAKQTSSKLSASTTPRPRAPTTPQVHPSNALKHILSSSSTKVKAIGREARTIAAVELSNNGESTHEADPDRKRLKVERSSINNIAKIGTHSDEPSLHIFAKLNGDNVFLYAIKRVDMPPTILQRWTSLVTSSLNEVRVEQVVLDGKIFSGCLGEKDPSKSTKLSLIRNFLHGNTNPLEGQQKTDQDPTVKPKSATGEPEANSKLPNECEEIRVGVHMQDRDVIVYAYTTSHGNLLFRLHADDMSRSNIQFNGSGVRFPNIVFDTKLKKDTDTDTKAYIRSKLQQISTPTKPEQPPGSAVELPEITLGPPEAEEDSDFNNIDKFEAALKSLLSYTNSLREQSLKDKEERHKVRQLNTDLDRRERDIITREENVQQREDEFKIKESNLVDTSSRLHLEHSSNLAEEKQKLKIKENDLNIRERDMKKREELHEKSKGVLENMKKGLDLRNGEFQSQSKKITELEEALRQVKTKYNSLEAAHNKCSIPPPRNTKVTIDSKRFQIVPEDNAYLGGMLYEDTSQHTVPKELGMSKWEQRDIMREYKFNISGDRLGNGRMIGEELYEEYKEGDVKKWVQKYPTLIIGNDGKQYVRWRKFEEVQEGVPTFRV
ncbi:hypothetical protein BGZ60DRAFT_511444 [Tricladium varicosporioides]|nr:hypothetical protein BGZ60DRAFT_511444 [Hymenoscyphus varicosporioides]